MPTLELTESIALNYETWGEPSSPAVVLLHGFTSDLRMWMPVAEELGVDYFVVAPDLRGHGLSSAPESLDDYSMEIYAEDVRALLDDLNLEVCAMVGCSFGGMVALQFATTWPERLAALVVSDSSPANESDRYDEAFRQRERRIAASAALVERHGMAGLAKRAAAAVTDPFLAGGMRNRVARMKADGFLGAWRARNDRPDLIPLLRERLTMPVLICVGSDDAVRPAANVMAEALPGARLVVFKDCGHAVPVRRPEEFTKTILRFFSGVEEGKPTGGRETI